MNPKFSVDSELETNLPAICKKKPTFKKINLSHFLLNPVRPTTLVESPLASVRSEEEFSTPPTNLDLSVCKSTTCQLLEKCLQVGHLDKPLVSQCIRRLFKDF